MSRLDELIRNLCPDRVEFRKLGEISQYCKERIDASTVDKTCYVGVENLLQNKQGKTLSSAVPTTGQVIAFSFGDILIGNIRPYLKKIWLADCNGGTNGDVLAIHITDSGMLPEFLYYVLSSDSFFHYDMQYAKGSKMPRGSKEAVLQYITPVPPLPVQREIVRILDNFTELTEGLNRELAAELTARKKQYAYYRDKLLAHSSETKICKLADVCESIADGDHMPPPKADDGIPFITISNITEQNKINFSNTMFVPSSYYDALADKRKPHSGDILYTVVGSYGIPVCIEQDTKFVFQRHIAILRPRSEVIKARYMFHAMQSGTFKAQADKAAKGAAQKTIGLSSLAEMTLPVPDMCIQERLVRVLDNFDAICTDLNIGLPAEIEARQKQYEYYRDKLLSFEEKT